MLKIPSPLELLQDHPGKERGIRIFIKRDDLIHPDISGNKWRKLKYNIEKAKNQEAHTLVTAGGPWSNHLAATSVAGKMFEKKTKAFVRGVEPENWSDTLVFCKEQGMEFKFLPKAEFDQMDFYQQLSVGEYYIPLGGENELGRKGCSEIIDEIDIDFDILCTSIGTGTTIRGLADVIPQKQVLGFSALNSTNQHTADFNEWVTGNPHVIVYMEAFGGFAKTTLELEDFIVRFYEDNKIILDPVYNGKMMFKVFSLIEKRQISKNTTIVVLHTGGIQGIKGFPDLHSRLFTS